MKPPLFVRELTDAERQALQAGLRSREAFTLRRAQILLASADGQRPSADRRAASAAPSAPSATPSTPSRRRARAAWPRRSAAPRTRQPILDEAKADPLKGLLHQSPRRFGKARSTWTLDLLAEVAFAQGLTPRRLSDEAIRQALKRLGTAGSGPRPGSPAPTRRTREKKARDRLIRLAGAHPDWVLGYQDEVLVEPAGAAGDARLGRRGPSRCGWSSRRSEGATRTPRRWPATGCCGRTRAG